MITLTDVRKRFGTVIAVDGMSLEAADGQITTLLGANGSGKTTSLRIIAGLIKPDSGEGSRPSGPIGTHGRLTREIGW